MAYKELRLLADMRIGYGVPRNYYILTARRAERCKYRIGTSYHRKVLMDGDYSREVMEQAMKDAKEACKGSQLIYDFRIETITDKFPLDWQTNADNVVIHEDIAENYL